MGDTSIAEYLIAVLVAMAIVVTFRRKVPRALEVAVWATLIYVCVLAITNTPNPQARALTTATAWAASRIVGMMAGLSGQGVARWTYDVRFVIADLVVVLFALDLFVLALVSTRRQANAWIPVTRLGEWMVLPRLAPAQPERAAVSAVDEINERLRVWGAAAAAATITWSILVFIWMRDFGIPYAARGLRKVEWGTVLAWRRVAAGRPQLGEVRISRVMPAPAKAVGKTGSTKRRVATRPAALRPNIVDINLLADRVEARKLKAATAPRKPRRRPAPTAPQPEVRTNKNGSKKQNRQGRLAS